MRAALAAVLTEPRYGAAAREVAAEVAATPDSGEVLTGLLEGARP